MANKILNKCARLRLSPQGIVARLLSPNAPWAQNHIAHCPRCQKRFAKLGRVELGLTLLQAQPHGLDLLMKANVKAIAMLKNNLRETVAAEKLKIAKVDTKFFERSLPFVRPVVNTAACFAILVLLKAGIFKSMDNFEQSGDKIVKQYYSNRTGQEFD